MTDQHMFSQHTIKENEMNEIKEREFSLQALYDLGPDAQKVMDRAMDALSQMLEYQDLMLYYDAAIKIVCTKLDIITAVYQARYQRNPIHAVSSRRKKPMSIVRKLYLKDMDATVANIERHLHDVAGVRVICPYLDDIYEVANAVIRQDDVNLVNQKDYIAAPKPNGYRSLHLIVSVPVSFADQRREVEVEIQIRTIAMDFWASLEHQLRYKKDVDADIEIVHRLHACAETIAWTDSEMLALRRHMEVNAPTASKQVQMIERLERLNLVTD